MADTIRTKAQVLALMPNNNSGQISPQDMRDFIVSIYDAVSALSTRTLTGDTTLAATDHVVLVDASGGDVTLTLPLAASRLSEFCIKKIDSSGNTVTIDGNGGETIDGSTTFVLTEQYDALRIFSDATEWWVL